MVKSQSLTSRGEKGAGATLRKVQCHASPVQSCGLKRCPWCTHKSTTTAASPYGTHRCLCRHTLGPASTDPVHHHFNHVTRQVCFMGIPISTRRHSRSLRCTRPIVLFLAQGGVSQISPWCLTWPAWRVRIGMPGRSAAQGTPERKTLSKASTTSKAGPTRLKCSS
jgi:hypothetical protein